MSKSNKKFQTLSHIKVKSIKITEKKFDTKKLDFKLSPNEEKTLFSLLPPPEKSIVFELDKTSSGFANGLRRAIEDEIPIYSLNCKIYNFMSDDKKIMTTSDCIVRRINLIPITQKLAKQAAESKLNLFIDIKNDTDSSILVQSKDIQIIQPIKKSINTKGEYKKDKGKIISNKRYFSGLISICELDIGKRLVISDITIFQNKNYELSIGGLIHGFTYLPADYAQDIKTNKDTLPNCLVTNPTRYYLGYSMNNVETPPEYIMLMACDVLTERFNNIKKEIELSDNEVPYNSDLLAIDKTEKYTIYTITDESWTIGYMLKRYCYNIDPAVIFPRNKHALSNYILIVTNHTQSQKLLIKAIDAIVKDLSIVITAFKK